MGKPVTALEKVGAPKSKNRYQKWRCARCFSIFSATDFHYNTISNVSMVKLSFLKNVTIIVNGQAGIDENNRIPLLRTGYKTLFLS